MSGMPACDAPELLAAVRTRSPSRRSTDPVGRFCDLGGSYMAHRRFPFRDRYSPGIVSRPRQAVADGARRRGLARRAFLDNRRLEWAGRRMVVVERARG